MTPGRGKRSDSVDWGDLRSRVEAAARALTDGRSSSPEKSAAILEERARALARPAVESLPGATEALVTFSAGGVRYGVDPARVLEMCRAGHVVPLPGADAWIAGLAVWRGELVHALDLGVLLSGAAASVAPQPAMLVVGEERPSLALLADGPGELETVEAMDLRPPPEESGGREFIRGVSSAAVVVLDLKRVVEIAGREPA
jgi:purine-binding chemotaxis protein CheW